MSRSMFVALKTMLMSSSLSNHDLQPLAQALAILDRNPKVAAEFVRIIKESK